MEVLRNCMVFFITLINFNWFKDTKDFATCNPVQDRDTMNNFENIFGPENVPRPSLFSTIGRDTTSAKKYMMNLYKFTTENGKQRLDDDHELVNQTVVEKADTVVSFVNHAYPPRPNASDEDGAMFFDVQTLSNFAIENTLQSDLRIYLNSSIKSVIDQSLKITIYQIVIPKRKYLLLTSRIINASVSNWHDFDILKATQSWKEDESTNNGVYVACQSSSDNRARTMKECGLIDFKGDSDSKPFLVSFHQSGDEEEILAEQVPQIEEEPEIHSHRRYPIPDRLRRSLEHLLSDTSKLLIPRISSNIPQSNKTCARHNLEIRFKDLGWADWIIAPEKYEAAYCGGDCPFPLNDNMNATNHAIIQTLVHLIAESELPKPCCAPKDLQELQVLFLDEWNNIVMKRYANMVVTNSYLPRPNASDEDGAMFFDVQSLLNFVIESTLKSDLRIYLNTSKKTLRDSQLTVSIHQIIVPRKEYRLITRRIINASESQWHDFDILEASLLWKEYPEQNKGVVVDCRSSDKKRRTMKECGLVDFKGESENIPFLVSFYQSGDEDELLAEQLPQGDQGDKFKFQEKGNVARSKRSLLTLFPHAQDSFQRYQTRSEHPENTTCIRHALYIRFKDLGWSEYIIAPEGYEAAYCRGACPFPLHDNMNASNHAIIQTLVHLISSDIPQPCCSPLRLAPLKVLFYNENTSIVMKRYTNMVVHDCGCQ